MELVDEFSIIRIANKNSCLKSKILLIYLHSFYALNLFVGVFFKLKKIKNLNFEIHYTCHLYSNYKNKK